MKNYIIIFITILFFYSFLSAQNYTGKQRSLQLYGSDIAELAGSEDDIEALSSFFFDLNYNDLLEKISLAGLQAETVESVIFVEDKHIRMDMNSEGEKMSYIINLETKKVFTIMHTQKQYMEMDLDEIKAMQSRIKESVSAQMENMQGMMENMPPEARAMMEKLTGKPKAPPVITSTGKSRNINGFPCKQYIADEEDGREMVWATTKYPALRDAFYQVTQAMPSDDGETDALWDQIGEGWPVVSHNIKIQHDHMDGSYDYSEIYSIETASHKKGTFDPPAAYERKTMQDMMMPGM